MFQIQLVYSGEYSWLYINGESQYEGDDIPTYLFLDVINTFDLDGSYAVYEINEHYIFEQMELPCMFKNIPEDKLELLNSKFKRQT